MKKTYVLDTNVLLHDPQALFRFQDNDLWVPITVVEEIDHFKKDLSETGKELEKNELTKELGKALEKTDYVGTNGRVEFYGPKQKYAHGMKYGKGYVTGTVFQWLNAKQGAI